MMEDIIHLVEMCMFFSDVVSSEMALSKEYYPELSDSSSQEFKNLSTQFCNAVCTMYFGGIFVGYTIIPNRNINKK